MEDWLAPNCLVLQVVLGPVNYGGQSRNPSNKWSPRQLILGFGLCSLLWSGWRRKHGVGGLICSQPATAFSFTINLSILYNVLNLSCIILRDWHFKLFVNQYVFNIEESYEQYWTVVCLA